MKRALLAALLLLPSAASAQAKFWGLAAGASLSDYSDDFGGLESNDRWGFTGGLVFGVRTANWMAISLEPSYTQMGGGDLRADYLEIPLTFGGVARSGDGSMRYGGYTGITGGFKMSCSFSSSVISDPCEDIKGSAWFIPLGLRILTAHQRQHLRRDRHQVQHPAGQLVRLRERQSAELGVSAHHGQRSRSGRLRQQSENCPLPIANFKGIAMRGSVLQADRATPLKWAMGNGQSALFRLLLCSDGLV